MKYMDYELSYMERFHIYLNYKSYMNLQYFIYETTHDFIYEIFMYEIVMRNFHICNVPYTVHTRFSPMKYSYMKFLMFEILHMKIISIQILL